jgi:peptidoglycan/LPS O-acetylase OafA/YrhL
LFLIFLLFVINFAVYKCMNSTLTDEEDHPCEKKTSLILKSLLNNIPLPGEYQDVYKLIINSGTSINDLGDYFACLNMGYTKYFLLQYIVPNTTGISLSMGFCYFKECDVEYLNKVKQDISGMYEKFKGKKIDTSSVFISESVVSNKQYRDKYFFGFTIVISITILFIVLSLVAWFYKVKPKRRSTVIYDIHEERRSNLGFIENESHRNSMLHNKTQLEKIFEYFDFERNSTKLFTIRSGNDKAHESLKIFDGVRFLSTCWVVFGHAFVFPLVVGLKNITDLQEFVKTFKFSFVISGFYAVDVFFYMSGFMLCFGLQKYMNRNINKFKVFGLALLNRYLRLLPLYLFILLGVTYLIPFISDGPAYSKLELINIGCAKNFWHNLLYFNNLVNYAIDESCAGHTWYLANDMQFYVVSLAIFVFLNNYRLIRELIFATIFIGSNAYQMYFSYIKNYTFLDMSHTSPDNMTFFNDFYIKPWMRITPFILGLYFCEFFLQSPVYLKDHNKEQSHEESNFSLIRKINKILIKSNILCLIVFILALLMINYAVFINYYINNYEFDIIWHAFFITFNKLFFVFGLGCLIHLTFLGKINFIYSILTIKPFSIFSRLTYGIYLFHIYVLLVVVLSSPSLLYLKFGDFVFLTTGYIIFSMLISYFFTILFESPVVHAIKLLFHPQQHQTPFKDEHKKLIENNDVKVDIN